MSKIESTKQHPKVDIKIGIVGAGVMGRVLGWHLLEQGYQVDIFDKDPIAHGCAAAYTAAGMLTPFAEIESAEMMIYQLGKISLKLWPQIISALPQPVAFHHEGTLVVSHRADAAELSRFNQQLAFKFNRDQYSEIDPSYQLVDKVRLNELEPEFSTEFDSATYLPDEAWISTVDAMSALAEGIVKKGGRWHQEFPVEHVYDNQIRTSGHRYTFDWIIDTRGLGAKSDVPGLRAVRGELIELEAPEVTINRLVRLMHPRYRIYLVPTYKDNRYLIGATQLESDDMGPITVRSTLELLSAAYSLHSGFAEAKVIQTKTNCRPALANNLPVIQLENNVIRVNGLYRHGFLLAPALAHEVSQLLELPEQYQCDYEGLLQYDAVEVVGND